MLVLKDSFRKFIKGYNQYLKTITLPSFVSKSCDVHSWDLEVKTNIGQLLC